MHQVEARVNQRAVQVEDHQPDGLGIKSAARANHRFQDKARDSAAVETSSQRLPSTQCVSLEPAARVRSVHGAACGRSFAIGPEPLTWNSIFPVISKYGAAPSKPSAAKAGERVAKYADMFSAMGTEPRLRIMQLLLTAHPEGLVVGEIQEELEIPNSTLSHHLDKLQDRRPGRECSARGTFLRYTANTVALQELLRFLYAECCTRNKAVKPQDIVQICK